MKLKSLRWPEEVKGQIAQCATLWWPILPLIFGVPLLVREFHKFHNFWIYLLSPISILCFTRFLWVKAHPFRPYFFTETPVSQMNDAQLRVLSFLASPQATFLLRRTEWAVAGGLTLVSLIDCLILWQGKPVDFSFFNSDTVTLGLSAAFVYLLFVGTVQFSVVFGWALRHFDEIQKTYPPWPKDIPYSHFGPKRT